MHQEIEQALQLPLLHLLSTIVIVTACIWAIAMLWLTFSFLKKLKQENKADWVAMGEPTLFRKNFSLMRFLFSSKTKLLSVQLAAIARVLRMMVYIGIMFILVFVVSFYYIYGAS